LCVYLFVPLEKQLFNSSFYWYTISLLSGTIDWLVLIDTLKELH
jgi:hypothetical protein